MLTEKQKDSDYPHCFDSPAFLTALFNRSSQARAVFKRLTSQQQGRSQTSWDESLANKFDFIPWENAEIIEFLGYLE